MEEVSKNLFMLTLPMPFRLMHVHVFILLTEEGVILFDAGLNTQENFHLLSQALNSLGKNIKDIREIFITHFHADHCGMAGLIKEIGGAKIAMSAAAEGLLGRRKNEIFYAQFRDFCYKCGLPQTTAESLLTMFVHFKEAPRPFEIDSYIEEKSYRRGNFLWEALFTPGHSPDHVSFYFPKEKHLIAGDHILPEITPNLSPDLLSPQYEPLKEFLTSLEKIQGYNIKKVLPAHGTPFLDLNRRVEELKNHHRLRTELIHKSLSGEKNVFQIACEIFGEDLTDFDYFLAIGETFAHLQYLVATGLIKENLREGRFCYEVLTQLV